MEENKALEIDIKTANASPDFAKAIFVQAHQLIALEQKQVGASRMLHSGRDMVFHS